MDAASDAAIAVHLGRVTGAMAPRAGRRSYLNFAVNPTAADRIHAPATLARLRAVKGRYDPGDVFRTNAGIAPVPLLERAA